MGAEPTAQDGRQLWHLRKGEEGDRQAQLIRSIRGALEERVHDLGGPLHRGALLSFLAGSQVTAADVRASFSDTDFARLVELKTTWDPGNVFRFNQNIPPTGDAD